VLELEQQLRDSSDAIGRLHDRIDELEDERDQAEEDHELAERRCERSKAYLQSELNSEREAREDLEYTADRERRAAGRR
jgi:prefoldin subunit 5